MGHALSMDLRVRLLAAIEGGLSCRAAAARFGVAPSTAIRWHAQQRETGSVAPKPQGGDMRSRRVEERSADLLARWAGGKDISLEELRLALNEAGPGDSGPGLHRFFARRGMTRKKRLGMPSGFVATADLKRKGGRSEANYAARIANCSARDGFGLKAYLACRLRIM